MGFGPVLSPDGRRIAFSATCHERDIGNVCLMNADGTGVEALVRGPERNGAPAWSPDGSRLAFTRSPEDSSSRSDLYTIGVDGTGERRITEGAAVESAPSWSPDGRSIAFTSSRDATLQIYTVGANGGPLTRLTRSGADDIAPVWSHDGAWFAFTSNRGGKAQSAFQRDANKRPFNGGLPSKPAQDVYIMRSDGSDVARLTDDPSDNGSPEWAPDDEHIAFNTDRDNTFAIYVMSRNGSEQRRVTAGFAVDPSWTR